MKSDEPADEVRTLARGGIAVALTTALTLALSVPTAAALVRALGRSEYGALAFSITLVTLTATLADFGLAAGGLARMAAYTRSHGERAAIARAGLVLGLIGGILASITCIAVASALHPPIRGILAVTSPLACLLVVKAVMTSVLRVSRRIGVAEGATAVGQLFYYGTALAMAALGVATSMRVAAIRVVTIGVAVSLLVRPWLRQADHPLKVSGTSRQLLRFSLPLVIGSASWIAMQQSDVILLGVFRGSTAVGLYSPILQTVDLLTTVMFVLTAYYLPTASSLAGSSRNRLENLYVVVTKWGMLLCAPLLGGIIVAPEGLLGNLFGANWATPEAGAIARVLCVGYAAFVITGQNGTTLLALGNSKLIATRSALSVVVNLGLNLALIPIFGPIGAAAGTTCAYLTLNIANSLFLWRKSRIHPFRRDYLAVLAATGVLTVASLFFSQLTHSENSLIVPLASGVLVAVGGLVAWVMTASPLELSLSPLRRIRPTR